MGPWKWTDCLYAEEASVARGANGADPYGTFNQASTYAIMEFLDTADSNKIKSVWNKYKAKDISPLWGTKSTVPTFKKDKAVIDKWYDFQQQMQHVDPDWIYLSGHHGREYESDSQGQTVQQHADGQKEIGFFNHVYHDNTWHKGTAAEPDPLEVYMTTSSDPHDPDNLMPWDNPFYTRVREDVKGVMLVGCNTLIYMHDRIQYNYYFPNAVVIGLMSREGSSLNKMIKAFDRHGRAFFDDPTIVDPPDLVKLMNNYAGANDWVAVQYGNELFRPVGKKDVKTQVATDPIEP